MGKDFVFFFREEKGREWVGGIFFGGLYRNFGSFEKNKSLRLSYIYNLFWVALYDWVIHIGKLGNI